MTVLVGIVWGIALGKALGILLLIVLEPERTMLPHVTYAEGLQMMMEDTL